jgi:hypothetical protein
VLAMGFDHLDAQMERLRDLAGAPALPDQAKHLQLAVAERLNTLSRLTGLRTGWAWCVPHWNPPSGGLASAQLLAQDVEVPADGCDDPFAYSSDLGDDRINPRGLRLINWHRHARIPLPLVRRVYTG